MQDASTTLPRQKTGQKSPATRLMDLLAGWSDFVSVDEAEGICDAGLSAEEVGALYQQVSALLDAPDEAQAVEAFVTERILPLLLR